MMLTIFDKPKKKYGFWYKFQAMFGWDENL